MKLTLTLKQTTRFIYFFYLSSLFGSTVDPAQIMSRANESYETGEFDQAALLYSQVLEKEPDNLACLIALGKITLYSNRLSEAEKLLSAAFNMAPDNEEVKLAMSEVFYRQDQFSKAASYLSTPETSAKKRSWKVLQAFSRTRRSS